jgi:hypothetical protein
MLNDETPLGVTDALPLATGMRRWRSACHGLGAPL